MTKIKNFIFLMDDKEFEKLNSKLSSHYEYKVGISRVWNLIKDMEVSTPLLLDYRSNLQYVVGTNTYEEGNIFKYLWKNHMAVIGKVVYKANNRSRR